MTPTVSLISASSAAAQEQKPRDLAAAAKQFEALLLSQLLKSACDAATLTGGEPDVASCTAIEMAQEHFANALAEQGGLGLARMITDSTRPGSED